MGALQSWHGYESRLPVLGGAQDRHQQRAGLLLRPSPGLRWRIPTEQERWSRRQERSITACLQMPKTFRMLAGLKCLHTAWRYSDEDSF